MTKSLDLKVAFLNVCSLRRKVREVRNLIENNGIHIMCIAESWLDRSVTDGELSIPFFRLYRRDRPDGVGGGVCIYCHESVSVLRRPDLESDMLELLWLEVHEKKGKRLLGCYYRPPSGSVSSWEVLDENVAGATTVTSNIIIVGDFNVNMLEPHSTSMQHARSFLSKFQFSNRVHSPTRVSRGSSTLIDWVLATVPGDILCNVMPCDISDHYAVMGTLSGHCPKARVLVRSRNLATIDWITEMNADLTDKLKDYSVSAGNLDEDVVHWQTVVLGVLDKLAPCKRRNRRSERPCPWLTPELQSAVRQRNYLHRRLCKDPANDDLRQAHKQARRCARKLERQLRNKYFQKMCETTQPRLLWRAINTATGRTRKSSSVKAKLIDLHSTFANVVHDPTRPATLSVPAGPPCEHSLLSFHPVSLHDVLLLLRSIDITKATGSDDIPGVVLKNCASTLAPSLTQIFNASLECSSVPKSFKMSNVVPIFKAGDPCKATNYRPVSLLPIVSRLLEKVVQRQVVTHLTDYGYLPDSQFAYRKGHSTEDALILAVNRWQTARFNRQSTAVAFLDMSKAFDRVVHTKLIHELSLVSIHGAALAWIVDYLSDREQRVKLFSEYSQPVSCSRGVPQGSVLGPLLFTLYIRRLGHRVPISVSHQEFADDVVLDCSGPNIHTIAQDLSVAITDVSSWLTDMGLLLNPSKTQVMFIHPRGLAPPDPIVYCGTTPLTSIAAVKYLGLEIDSNFSWSTRLAVLDARVTQLAGAMWRNGRALTLSARRSWLIALVRSHLTYSSTAFVPSLGTQQLQRLVKMFKYAVRTVFRVRPPVSSTPLLRKLNIPTLTTTLHDKISLFVHRCLHKGASLLFSNMFVLVSTSSNEVRLATRGSQANLLVVPFMPGPAGRCSIQYYGSVLWNALPQQLRKLASQSDFKRELCLHICSLPPQF